MNPLWYPTMAALLFVAGLPVSAQWWKGVPPDNVWLTQVGFAAHGTATQQGTDFLLPYAPTCCTAYGSDLSFGLSLSGLLRQEITKHLRLNLRVTYTPMTATFETDEQILVSGNVPGLVRHTLNTSLTYLGAEFIADVRLGSPFRLLLGGSAGSFLQGVYDQSESLVQPGTGTFENGMRVRNETRNAQLQSLASPAVWMMLGVGYDLPLTENHDVMITPEVLYSIAMTDVVEGTGWTANQLRIGASIAFALNAPQPPLPTEYRKKEITDSVVVAVPPDGSRYRSVGPERVVTDTTIENDVVYFTDNVYRTDTVFMPEKPIVTAKLSARSRRDDGTELDAFTIRVSTQFVTEALPLLPAVFFESASSALPARYRTLANPDSFREEELVSRTTAVHRDVLNILGKRMRDRVASTITLRGNSDPTTEGSSCELASKRAEAVKFYLVNTWGIAPERIVVAQRSGECAPSRPTREQSEAGYSENRRVEIETSHLDLLAPVAKRRFNEARVVDPPSIVLDPTGTTMRYLTNWTVDATSGNANIFTRRGEGAPGVLTQTFSVASADAMKANTPLVITLNVQALQGVTAEATATLPVERDTMATEVERLTLTLFEVSSDELSALAMSQIRSFIDNVPTGSRVIVRGYADMLGNAEFNRKLSQRRAETVCAVLRKNLKKKVSLECTEIATNRYPPGIESYDTPEERFLSRTVQIEILKPRP